MPKVVVLVREYSDKTIRAVLPTRPAGVREGYAQSYTEDLVAGGAEVAGFILTTKPVTKSKAASFVKKLEDLTDLDLLHVEEPSPSALADFATILEETRAEVVTPG